MGHAISYIEHQFRRISSSINSYLTASFIHKYENDHTLTSFVSGTLSSIFVWNYLIDKKNKIIIDKQKY